MEIYQKCLNWLIKVMRLIGAFALTAMMMVTCVDVILRGCGHPVIWALDMVGFLAVIVLASALPYTHMEGGHVGVDLLVLKMKPLNQAIIDSITSLVSLILFSLVTWQMFLYARELASKGEVSMTVQIPKDPFIYLVAVCFGLLSAVILSDVVRFIGKAVKE